MGKTAYLVINPRSGKNLAKLSDILAVFSAAGWKTDLALKEFGGHTMKLATEGAEAGYDLVIGYGGDGTLNQVVNGVMAAKGRRCIVGVIPGGTANVWARQIGLPEDPVKAALGLVNSEGRKVDIGHVGVDSITFASRTKDPQKVVRPLVRRTGEPLLPAFAAELPEGSALVVEGKQSKRGVIRAKRVVVLGSLA
jgi:diacylglycerol kinase family enzyme